MGKEITLTGVDPRVGPSERSVQPRGPDNSQHHPPVGWTARRGGVSLSLTVCKHRLGDLSKCLLGSVLRTSPGGKRDSPERNTVATL